MRSFILSFLLIVVFVLNLSAGENGKYHLVRLDDMGMCHSVNMAIQKVIDSGLPVSTSVMFACPWYQEAVDILKQNPQVAVGVHLTLNAEWKNYRWGPVTGREAVPSLVDEFGFFFPSRKKFFDNNPRFEEIEKELRAQIDRAVGSGLKIDYLDYHMGTAVQTAELRQLVERLAAEYRIGIAQYFGEQYSNATYAAKIGNKADSLVAEVGRMKPGINLQVVHVGLDTPEMQAMKDLNPFGLADMSRQRQDELNAIISDDFRKSLKTHGLKSITYRDLISMTGLENMKRPENIE